MLGKTVMIACATFILTAGVGAEDRSEVALLLAPDGAVQDGFGRAVALDGELAIVGAPGDSNQNGTYAGAAHIYRRVSNVWRHEAKLIASDGQGSDAFGAAVDISGNLSIVGVPQDDDNDSESGSAYVFRRVGEKWVEEAKLHPGDAARRDRFGWAVAIEADVAVVGAPRKDGVPPGPLGTDVGSAYVFRYAEPSWMEDAKLVGTQTYSAHFGHCVDVDGGYVIIASGSDGEGYPSPGAVYVAHGTEAGWVYEARLVASDGTSGDAFGHRAAISGEHVVVGAPADDPNGMYSGSAYVYRRDGSMWQEAKLIPGDGMPGGFFGSSVAIDGDRVVVGAFERPAYEYRRVGGTWNHVSTMTASDAVAGDQFGNSAAAISGGSVLIGSDHDDDRGADSGSAFLFALDHPGACLTLRAANPVAGQIMTLSIRGGTPDTRGIAVFGINPGSTVVAGTAGYCATFSITDLSQGSVVGARNRVFNQAGEISFDLPVPNGAIGRTVLLQAAERGTCPKECTSNVMELTFQ